MSDSAADVPGKFDIIIDGHGYICARQVDPNIPFRTQRARFGFSPTFLERTNITGAYGDDQQAFWLTYTQNDWSGGEGLRFARPNDANKVNMFWLGKNLETRTPGQVTPQLQVDSLTFAASVYGAVEAEGLFYTVSSTTLYSFNTSGITSKGTHSAGSTASDSPLATDGASIYIGGATSLRAYSIGGGTFSTFSTTPSTVLAYLNNTLYGGNGAHLYQYDTSGTATEVYQFKAADGTASGQFQIARLIPYGGDLAVLVNTPTGYELYVWDGTGISRIAGFPLSFLPQDVKVVNELLLIIGKSENASYQTKCQIYYYSSGNIGLLYNPPMYVASTTYGGEALVGAGEGFYFTDGPQGLIRFYDLTIGAYSTVGSYTTQNQAVGHLASDTHGVIAFIQNGTTGQSYLFDNSSYGTGVVETSLIDFDSSLPKYVRGITLDFGGAGTVDIAYQLDGLEGSWTSLKTGASVGVEYLVNQTCRSIAVKVTLNPGSASPVLKRLYVRAVPILQSYRNDDVILDLTGRDGKTPVILQNGNPHNLDGQAMLTNLRASITSTTPITITDRLGTFTGVIQPDTVDIVEVRPQEYYARFNMREI